MKAVLLYSYGYPSQLRYEETETPRYGDNEVLVRLLATSINPIDVKIRNRAQELGLKAGLSVTSDKLR